MKTTSKARVTKQVNTMRAVIKRALQDEGVPIAALAACSGVTPSTLAQWLAGRQQSLPLTSLLRVADALGVGIQVLSHDSPDI